MNSEKVIDLRKKTKSIQEKITDLNFLSNCKPKVRKYILTHSDKKLLAVINECMFNLLKGNIKIDTKTFEKLKKHKNAIRLLVNCNCFKKKKQLLVQKGGFLPIVLPVVVDLISRLLT